MVDKNLFPYNLAVVAIFKDEAPYLREWVDYHLLAGVEHFYLYNNDSSDGYEKILAPYVEANLVTLIDWSGKAMQNPAYLDALNRFRFFCRYVAVIDLDEFILPKIDGGGVSSILSTKFFRVTKLLRHLNSTGNVSAQTVMRRRICPKAFWNVSLVALQVIGFLRTKN